MLLIINFQIYLASIQGFINHQSIAVLHSNSKSSKDNTYVEPSLISLSYYGRSDFRLRDLIIGLSNSNNQYSEYWIHNNSIVEAVVHDFEVDSTSISILENEYQSNLDNVTQSKVDQAKIESQHYSLLSLPDNLPPYSLKSDDDNYSDQHSSPSYADVVSSNNDNDDINPNSNTTPKLSKATNLFSNPISHSNSTQSNNTTNTNTTDNTNNTNSNNDNNDLIYDYDNFNSSINNIQMYIQCSICKSKSKQNDMTNLVGLYSFAKFLELLYYSNDFLPKNLCDHSNLVLGSRSSLIKTNDKALIPTKFTFTRNFILPFKGKLITFLIKPLNPFELRGPKIQINPNSINDNNYDENKVENYKLDQKSSDDLLNSTRKDIALYFTTEARGTLNDLLRDYYNSISNKKSNRRKYQSGTVNEQNFNYNNGHNNFNTIGNSKSISQASATLLAISQASGGPATISSSTHNKLMSNPLTPAAATANRIKRLFDQQELELLQLLKETKPEHANNVRRKLKETSKSCKNRLNSFKNKFIRESYYDSKNKSSSKKLDEERKKNNEINESNNINRSNSNNSSSNINNNDEDDLVNNTNNYNLNSKERSKDNKFIPKNYNENDYLNDSKVHAFPDSCILVREDEPSSIISFALSLV